MSQRERSEFHRVFSRQFLAYLDIGHGDCVLKQPKCARIVSEGLLHFEGDRYLMGDFVVMPNHVHLLVCLLGNTNVEQQCLSWKRYTGTQINRALGRRGEFWQPESFDHLVRSPEQFEHCRRYIAANPQKAALRTGEYLLYRRPVVESLRD